VAAGNDNIDARNVSPAREPSVITVAASTISDSKADFSNYGPAIDVFAPGLNVISAWYTSDTVSTHNLNPVYTVF
jgi:cerevisin